MSDFFNDLTDVELGVKDGKYPAYIVKSEIITKKDDTKAWVLTYRISDGAQKGEQVQEWFNRYPNDADKEANAKKWRARRLESLGVPESRWASYDPAEAVGTFGIIGVKTSGSFTNISSFVLADENTGLPLNGSGGNAPAVAPAQSMSAPVATPAPTGDVSSLM